MLNHYTRGLLWLADRCYRMRRKEQKNGEDTGRSLHCQVENHVRTKFATPILYAIDNFKNYDIFYIYISIDNIFCIFF